METLSYKKYMIVLDPKSYWNSKTFGGDVIAKIYDKNDNCILKTKYLFYKKKEIVKMLKQKINERINKNEI